MSEQLSDISQLETSRILTGYGDLIVSTLVAEVAAGTISNEMLERGLDNDTYMRSVLIPMVRIASIAGKIITDPRMKFVTASVCRKQSNFSWANTFQAKTVNPHDQWIYSTDPGKLVEDVPESAVQVYEMRFNLEYSEVSNLIIPMHPAHAARILFDQWQGQPGLLCSGHISNRFIVKWHTGALLDLSIKKTRYAKQWETNFRTLTPNTHYNKGEQIFSLRP